jgi:hypothetical protein
MGDSFVTLDLLSGFLRESIGKFCAAVSYIQYEQKDK